MFDKSVKLGERWSTITSMHETGDIKWIQFQKIDPSRVDDPEAIELAFWLQNTSPNDPAVLERLVSRYASELYLWVEILAYYRKKSQPLQAEILDILKMVFGTAIKNVEQFHGKDSVTDWLFGIAYHLTNRWRFSPESQVVNRRLHQVTEFVEQPQTLLPAEQDNLRLFPEKIRTMLILRYLYKFELDEIANICNRQENEVHHWLTKGRKQLIGNRVISHMEVKIQAYVDGLFENDPDKLDEFERHLAECEGCQQALLQIETLEKNLAEDLQKKWVTRTLSNERLNVSIQSINDEMAKPETGLKLKIPVKQITWIVGLAVMLAGFAIISIKLTPAVKLLALPETTLPQQLPPIVEMQQSAGVSQNRIDVQSAPQYIAPAFSNDGKWAIFAATNYSLSSQSLIFQTIEVYNRDANTIQVISESSAFVNPWVWWDLAPSISGDGRWMVYVSTTREPHVSGDACTTPDNRSCLDIFLYDRVSGVTKRVTQADNGGAANGDSLAPTVSEDGQWIAFWSTADNLVEGFKNACEQNGIKIACLYIYLYNVGTGKISWIPIRTIPGDNVYGVDRISLSTDGRYIGFTIASSAQAGIPSLGSSLSLYAQGGANGNGVVDTYIPAILHSSEAIVYDRETAKYELENQTQAGIPGNGPSSSPVISADGRYVAFVSTSTNLVQGDNNNNSDVFVRDRETGKIELVSVSSTGQIGQGDSGSIFSTGGYYSLNISGDGRYVVFESSAGNLGIEGNQGCSNRDNTDCHYLYIHDRQTGRTQLISVLSSQDFSLFPDISSDGQWISFMQFFHDCRSTQSQCSNVMQYNRQSNWTTNLTKFDALTPTLPWSYSGSLPIPWQTWESMAFALSPDTTQIAIGGHDSKVRLWQITDVNNSSQNSEPVTTLETVGNDSFSALAFSPNGEWLAGGTTDGAVFVWELSDGKILYSLQDQPDLIRNLVFTQDGSRLVVATLQAAWTWRFGDSQMFPVDGFSSSMTDAYNVDISPKGTMIASARGDGTIWLQSLPDGKVIARLGTNQLSARSLVFSNDGSLLATRSSDGIITIWNIKGNRDEITSITLVNSYKSSGATGELTFSPDNKYLAGSRTAGEISFWRIPDGKVFTLETPVTQGILYSLVFGDGGDKLAAVFETEIALWGIHKDSSSTYYEHATSDGYVDSKPIPEASANDIRGFQSPSNSVKVGKLSLDQLSKLISFPMMVPTHLPGNISFTSASVNKDGSISLLYDVNNREGYQASLYIYEQSIKNSNPPTMTIGADASVLLTQVNTSTGNSLAEFVQGDWTWGQSYTPANGNLVNGVTHNVWYWDSSSSSQRLRWQQSGILIGLYYQVNLPYSPVMYMSIENDHIIHLSSALNQGDMVQIASGMTSYSEMNAENISYKPGGNEVNSLNDLHFTRIDQLYSTANVDKMLTIQDILLSSTEKEGWCING